MSKIISFMITLLVLFGSHLVNLSAADNNTFQEISMAVLPKKSSELFGNSGYDLSNPYITAALTIAALMRYTENPAEALEMLNMLKGPEPLFRRECNFIRERLSGKKSCVPRSYFIGATPENNYTPVAPPYRIRVKIQANNGNNQEILKLFVISSGAATPRPMTLRYKHSAKKWFLYEFSSLLSNVKPPKVADPWH